MLGKKYAYLFILILFSPYILVLLNVDINISKSIPWHEFISTLYRSFVQSSLSAALSVSLGFISAFGLLRVANKKYFNILSAVIWIPNLLPSIIFILSAITLFNFFGDFPYGLTGVVLLHSLLNIGICSLAFVKLIPLKIGPQLELALVEGSSRSHFLFKAFFQSMYSEIFFIFVFVFIFCLSSFSIPLIVGGSQATSLEVLIYEQIKLHSNWSQAALFSLLQLLFISSFYFFTKRMLIVSENTSEINDRSSEGSVAKINTSLIEFQGLGFIPLAISASFILGILSISYKGFSELYKMPSFIDTLNLLLTSLSISFLVGLSVMALSILFLLVSTRGLQDFLISMGLPSSAIVAFGFYLVRENSGLISIINLILSLSLILFIPSYKIFLHQRILSLEKQIQFSQIFGGSPFLILRKIILPQIWPFLCYMGGASALWACGDFAISSILLEKDFTLALRIKTLLSVYQIDQASLLSLLLLFLGAILILLFWSLSYAFNKKPQS